jgi:hypothetical protein
MNPVVDYSIGLLFCCGLFYASRYSFAHPEKIARFFAWGQPPVRWTITSARLGGRFFLVMSVIGVVFYLFLVVANLFGKHV